MANVNGCDGNAVSKVVFVADFFKEDVTAGAELHDDVVIQHFKKCDLLLERKKCSLLTEEYIKANIDKVWFIGNFVSLTNSLKQLLINECKYILYEHDYKFLSNRNPIMFKDFTAGKPWIHNLDFYQSAKRVICLSQYQRSIYERNLTLSNLVNIHCSMWSDEDLDFMKTLINIKKKSGLFAVISSHNPIKRTADAIKYCENNGLAYELISSQNYYDFLSQLAQYEGLVFMTGHPEPTPRVAIEAKILNCKFIAQKNLIGVAHEDYFHLTGIAMIKKVRALRDDACEDIVNFINSL